MVERVVAGEEVAAVEGPVRHVEQGLGGDNVEEGADEEPLGVPEREVPQRREGVERRGRHQYLQYQEVVPGRNTHTRRPEPNFLLARRTPA